jgi:hypothetical protein
MAKEKLKLEVENLAVQSFTTTRADRKRGTVRAHCSVTIPDTDTDYDTCDYCTADSLGLTGLCCPPGSLGSSCIQRDCQC